MPQLMLINPRKRRKTASKKRRTVRRNPVSAAPRRKRRVSTVARKVRRMRRNPAPRSGGIMNDLTNAAIGAGGAIAVNTVYNFLPLPVNMKVGMGASIGKAATAIALGMMGRKVLGSAAGKMASGALTVIAYDLINGVVAGAGKAKTVAGLGYAGSGYDGGYIEQPTNVDFASNIALPDTGVSGFGEYVPMGEYVDEYAESDYSY